jgi:hypothetical protein
MVIITIKIREEGQALAMGMERTEQDATPLELSMARVAQLGVKDEMDRFDTFMQAKNAGFGVDYCEGPEAAMQMEKHRVL